MKINKIELTKFRWEPIGFTVMATYGKLEYMHEVVIKIHCSDGTVGIGEIGDLNVTHSGETVGSAVSLIKDYIGPKILLGEDPTNLEKIMAKMDGLVKGNTVCKAGIDYALHDLVAKIYNEPVFKLLGGRVKDRVPVCKVIGVEDPREEGEEAVKAIKDGFNYIKIKVGFDPLKDVERVRIVKEAIGNDGHLMVDANMGYTPRVAIWALNQFAKYDVELAEQPIPAWDLKGLAKVRQQCHIPIMADEAAWSIKELMQLIRLEAIDAVLFKVSKVGGLRVAQRMIAIAEAAGVDCCLAPLGGTGIQHAALGHLSTASAYTGKSWPDHYIGQTPTELGVKDIAKCIGVSPKAEKGFYYVYDKPGLGVEVDQEVLKEYMIEEPLEVTL